MSNFEFENLLAAVRDAIKTGTEKELQELCKEFNTPIQNIVKTGWVYSNCSDILFINRTPLSVTTNGNIQVNNYVLAPGDFISIGGNNAEINKDQYNVVFDSDATFCTVVKKLYTKK